MLSLLTLLNFKKYDCEFHDVPNTVSALYSAYVSFKPKTSIKLFNISTQPSIQTSYTFYGYVTQFRAFTLGDGYSAIPIIIISCITIIVALVISFSCACACIPHKSTRPGICSLISYIIFSIIFFVSMIYYCMNIYYGEGFYSQFTNFPEVANAALVNLKEDFLSYNDTQCGRKKKDLYDEVASIIDKGINSTYLLEHHFRRVPVRTWTIIRVWIYIFFAFFILMYIFQTLVYFSRSKLSICCASSYSFFVIIVALLFGALGVTVTAIATAGKDVCENGYDLTQNFFNQFLSNTSIQEIPVDALKDPDFDYSKYYDWQECDPEENVTIPALSCGTNNTLSNFCANPVPYFASYSIFIHLMLISLIGFSIVIIVQRGSMLSDDTVAVYDQNQPYGVTSSPRKANNNVFDHPSSDFSDSDSYRVDHNRVGYL